MKEIFLPYMLYGGGGVYLLHKAFSNFVERTRVHGEHAAQGKWFWFWKEKASEAYLLGIPFIAILLFLEDAWLFGWLELGGIPAVAATMFQARKRRGEKRKKLPWYDWVVIASIPVGITFSVWDFHGLKAFTQYLEIVGAAGFLVGTYLQFKDRESCYWWFLLMNVGTGWLFFLRDQPVMVVQQILSIVFILDAHNVWLTKERELLKEKVTYEKE